MQSNQHAFSSYPQSKLPSNFWDCTLGDKNRKRYINLASEVAEARLIIVLLYFDQLN